MRLFLIVRKSDYDNQLLETDGNDAVVSSVEDSVTAVFGLNKFLRSFSDSMVFVHKKPAACITLVTRLCICPLQQYIPMVAASNATYG